MSESGPPQGVIVAHGTMAAGLVDAVRKIAGHAADALIPLTNEDRTPQDLRKELEAIADNGPVVVFADLQSGSCGMAAFSSCRGGKERAVICGVNLPVLLDFVFHRDLPLDDLIPRLVSKGREGIMDLQPSR